MRGTVRVGRAGTRAAGAVIEGDLRHPGGGRGGPGERRHSRKRSGGASGDACPGDILTRAISIVEGAKVSGRSRWTSPVFRKDSGFPQELINYPKLWTIINLCVPLIRVRRKLLLKCLSAVALLSAVSCGSHPGPRDSGRSHHPRLHRRRGVELRRVRRTPADPRLAAGSLSAMSRPAPPPSRTKRSGRSLRRGTTWSSRMDSSSRARPSECRTSIPGRSSSSRPGRGRRERRPADLPARRGELPGGDDRRRADQEQRDWIRRRNRAAADQGGVRGLGQRGHGGELRSAEPRDLSQQLRRRRGRAGGGAGA